MEEKDWWEEERFGSREYRMKGERGKKEGYESKVFRIRKCKE